MGRRERASASYQQQDASVHALNVHGLSGENAQIYGRAGDSHGQQVRGDWHLREYATQPLH